MTALPISGSLGSLAAAGLATLGDAPPWIAVLIMLPAVAGLTTAVLSGISRFRTESMRRRQEERLLLELTDPVLGLAHLERVQQPPLPPEQTPAAPTPATSPHTPTPGTPP
ncbi:hypothetical protein [Streptomyces sp. NPDC005799]|uniref:hypothetical protein n=1 Tax=Streptomyces sp. NPDC005799 TaxID=3154678 RepID=UPI0033EEF0CA